MEPLKQRKEMRRSYVLAITILSVALIGAMNLTFTVYVFRQFCGLIITLDEAYTEEPPTMPTGVRVARDIKHIRNSIFCS